MTPISVASNARELSFDIFPLTFCNAQRPISFQSGLFVPRGDYSQLEAPDGLALPIRYVAGLVIKKGTF